MVLLVFRSAFILRLSYYAILYKTTLYENANTMRTLTKTEIHYNYPILGYFNELLRTQLVFYDIVGSITLILPSTTLL